MVAASIGFDGPQLAEGVPNERDGDGERVRQAGGEAGAVTKRSVDGPEGLGEGGVGRNWDG
jgi:hypothetical protein